MWWLNDKKKRVVEKIELVGQEVVRDVYRDTEK